MFVPLPKTQFLRDRKKSAFRHVRAAASVTGDDSTGGRTPSANAGPKPATATPNWDSIWSVSDIEPEPRPPIAAHFPQTIVRPPTRRAQRANNARSAAPRIACARCFRGRFQWSRPISLAWRS